MDFKVVLEKLLGEFKRQNIRYALMGGFAMGLWGYGRATADMDFLALSDDRKKVEAIMSQLGYECRYQSENVAQYLSSLKIFGEIDFIFAFREASIGMLTRAEVKTVFNNTLPIRVLKPDDLIAMKLQAIKNDPSRRAIDESDIKMLLQLNANEMDYDLLARYVRLLGMEEFWNKIISADGQ